MTDSELIQFIQTRALLELEAHSPESLNKSLPEIQKKMESLGLEANSFVAQRIDFNKPSALTRQNDFLIHLISCAKKQVLQIKGDEIWQIQYSQKPIEQNLKLQILALFSEADQLWLKVFCEIEKNLKSQTQSHSGLGIYLWSLEGETNARTPGWWKLQLHFENPNATGGVEHITLGEGQSLPSSLADDLQRWIELKAKIYPGKHAPRIDLFAGS